MTKGAAYVGPAMILIAAALTMVLVPVALAQANAAPVTAASATPTSSAATSAQTPTVSVTRLGVVAPAALHVKFDVVIFKPCKAEDRGSSKVDLPLDGDYIAYHCQPIYRIVYFAYTGATDYTFKLSGYPAWVKNDLYDFEAKVVPEDIATWQKMDLNLRRVVLRGLLADELKLKIHMDTTPHPIYALTVAKNGPKLKEYKEGEQQKLPNGEVLTGRTMTWVGRTATFQNTTMSGLVESLSAHLDRQVVDRTGLKGTYNFSLPLPVGSGTNAGQDLGDDVPSASEGLAQLGLKLTATKGELGGLIVDHIERPTE